MAALKVSNGSCKSHSETVRGKKSEEKDSPNLALEGLSFYIGKLGDILLGWLFLITLLTGRIRIVIAEFVIYFIICVISAMLRGKDDDKENKN